VRRQRDLEAVGKDPADRAAVEALFRRVVARFGAEAPEGLLGLLVGGATSGSRWSTIRACRSFRPPVRPRWAALSANAWRAVSVAHSRTGRQQCLIVAPSADLDLTLRAVAFGAIGTAGQRCTTLRRLIVHADVYDRLVPGLISVYEKISVGSPLSSDALVGPLIDPPAFDAMQAALDSARAWAPRSTAASASM
jgi:aldehyde dehydrogenase (NAD+)